MRTGLADYQDRMLAALLGRSPVEGVDMPLSAMALRVHRNTIFSAAADALLANFPAVADELGAADFRAAACDFVRQQPPTDPRLVTYGAGFPAFLAHAGAAEAAGLARLDFAWIEAHCAGMAAAMLSIEPGQLASMRVMPHPAARWVGAEHPLIQRWSALRGMPLSMNAVETDRFLLLSRPHDVVLATPCDAGLAWLLGALHSEPRLLEAAMAACAVYPAFDVGSGFSRLLTAGALVSEPETGAAS